jgi:CheY-like chemotaxis protein
VRRASSIGSAVYTVTAGVAVTDWNETGNSPRGFFPMARILVAEDSPTQAQQLQFLLEDAGYEVELAGNGAEALAAIQRQTPDLVVTDLEMPQLNGLQLVEAVYRDHPGLPVVLMTAYGSEEIAALALQKGASSYVPKRYLAQDMVATVGNILAVARADRQHQRVLDFQTRCETQYVLPNDESIIPPLIGHLEEQLTRMKFADPTTLIRVSVALREALVNAMHHGNLEIKVEGGERDDKKRLALVGERSQQEPYRGRRVHVTATVTRRQAEYTVRDEGPGFDPTLWADTADPANLEKVNGRGLLLIRTFMDQVSHNETGNAITMVKRCE